MELAGMDEIADSYITALARFDAELARAAEKNYSRMPSANQQARRQKSRRGSRRRGDDESESTHSEEDDARRRVSAKERSKSLPLVSIPPKRHDDWAAGRGGAADPLPTDNSERFGPPTAARDWREQKKEEDDYELDLPDATIQTASRPLKEKKSTEANDPVQGPMRWLPEQSDDEANDSEGSETFQSRQMRLSTAKQSSVIPQHENRVKDSLASTMPVISRREVRSVVVGSQSMQSLPSASKEVESPTENTPSVSPKLEPEPLAKTQPEAQPQITRDVPMVKSQTVRQSLQSVVSAMSVDSLTPTVSNTQPKPLSVPTASLVKPSLTISIAPPASRTAQEPVQQSVDSSLVAEELGTSWYPSSPPGRQKSVLESAEDDPFDSPVRQPRTPIHSNAIDTSHSVIVDYSEGPPSIPPSLQNEKAIFSPSARQATTIRFEDTQSDESNSPAFIKGRGLSGQRGRGGEDDMVLLGTAQLGSTAMTFTTTTTQSSVLDRDSLASSQSYSASGPRKSTDEEEKRFFGSSMGGISGGTINSDAEKLSIADNPVDDFAHPSASGANDSRIDESFSAVLSTLSWTEGRAPIDLLELASALEVNIGAISLTKSKLPSQVQDVHVTVEFLDTRSHPSRSIHLDAPDAIYSLSFTTCKLHFAPAVLLDY